MKSKINPAYAHLAYQKAILQHMHHYLLSDVLASGGGEGVQILSEDVFFGHAEVPTEDIMEFAEEIQLQIVNLDLELRKFEFREIDVGDTPIKKATNGEAKRKKSKAQRNGAAEADAEESRESAEEIAESGESTPESSTRSN